uniref:Calcium regulated heat stable protein 1 n=1 Tax=Maylandia zebra TaxID=106582 RepID=A0A3P9D9J5_9CICH
RSCVSCCLPREQIPRWVGNCDWNGSCDLCLARRRSHFGKWLTRSAVLPFEPPLLPPHPLLCLFQHVLSRHCHQGVSTCDPSTAFSKIPTVSRTARASEGPVFTGMCKYFSRSKGHGFITPSDGGADIFVHISDIEGEYVPVEGDEVSYKVCCIPPKLEKIQAVEVTITHLKPGTKHETWSGRTVDS